MSRAGYWRRIGRLVGARDDKITGMYKRRNYLHGRRISKHFYGVRKSAIGHQLLRALGRHTIFVQLSIRHNPRNVLHISLSADIIKITPFSIPRPIFPRQSNRPPGRPWTPNPIHSIFRARSTSAAFPLQSRLQSYLSNSCYSPQRQPPTL